MIEEKIRQLEEKWIPKSYIRKRWCVRQELSALRETIHILAGEWFPKEAADWKDEDLNPDGTIVIDWVLEADQFRSFIVVGDNHCSEDHISTSILTENMHQFISEHYGLQPQNYVVKRRNEDDDHIRWTLYCTVNGKRLYPSSSIEIELNKQGDLTFLSQIGPLPGRDVPLSLPKHEPILQNEAINKAKTFWQSVYMPAEEIREDGKLSVSLMYGLCEHFITADAKQVYPFEVGVMSPNLDVEGTILTWDTEKEREIQVQGNLGKQWQVFREQLTSDIYPNPNYQIHPDLEPITSGQIEEIKEIICRWLQQKYPHDSGLWKIEKLYRDQGMLVVHLISIREEYEWSNKIKVYLDGETMSFIEVMDRSDWVQISSPIANITIEEAWKQVESAVSFEAMYVFDINQQGWLPLYFVDCPVLVDAEGGKSQEE
ncbi:hypothetical protein ACFDTO_15350 [Microbacteriaceae bacterium 4G12]